jgi:hypothetical protein
MTPTDKPAKSVNQQTADEFIPPVPPPIPTHEAYSYDKATNKKTVVAQGSRKEIKWFVEHNRTSSKWLYMREIDESGVDDAGIVNDIGGAIQLSGGSDGNQSEKGTFVVQGA